MTVLISCFNFNCLRIFWYFFPFFSSPSVYLWLRCTFFLPNSIFSLGCAFVLILQQFFLNCLKRVGSLHDVHLVYGCNRLFLTSALHNHIRPLMLIDRYLSLYVCFTGYLYEESHRLPHFSVHQNWAWTWCHLRIRRFLCIIFVILTRKACAGSRLHFDDFPSFWIFII